MDNKSLKYNCAIQIVNWSSNLWVQWSWLMIYLSRNIYIHSKAGTRVILAINNLPRRRHENTFALL